MSYNLIFLILAVVSTLEGSPLEQRDTYNAVLRGHLPSPQILTSSVYDGDDSIYIMGGVKAGTNVDWKVYQYNLTSEEVQEVSVFPRPLTYGTTQTNGRGDIFYFGGMDGLTFEAQSTIWKLGAEDRIPVAIGNLPVPLFYSASATLRGSSDGIYIIGGTTTGTYYPYILLFNSTTNEVRQVAEVGMIMDISMAVALDDGLIYILDASPFYDNGQNKVIRSFNPETESEGVAILPGSLPQALDRFSVAGADDAIYVVGGTPFPFADPEPTPTRLVVFNVTTQTSESPVVTNFPIDLRSSSSVYVPKLRRIYVIGGSVRYMLQDSIIAIDI